MCDTPVLIAVISSRTSESLVGLFRADGGKTPELLVLVVMTFKMSRACKDYIRVLAVILFFSFFYLFIYFFVCPVQEIVSGQRGSKSEEEEACVCFIRGKTLERTERYKRQVKSSAVFLNVPSER